jgi:C4-dicarboxylate-specific signal transduction histidine kinase
VRIRAEIAYFNRIATIGQLTASIAHEVNQPIKSGDALVNAEKWRRGALVFTHKTSYPTDE